MLKDQPLFYLFGTNRKMHSNFSLLLEILLLALIYHFVQFYIQIPARHISKMDYAFTRQAAIDASRQA